MFKHNNTINNSNNNNKPNKRQVGLVLMILDMNKNPRKNNKQRGSN